MLIVYFADVLSRYSASASAEVRPLPHGSISRFFKQDAPGVMTATLGGKKELPPLSAASCSSMPVVTSVL